MKYHFYWDTIDTTAVVIDENGNYLDIAETVELLNEMSEEVVSLKSQIVTLELEKGQWKS